MHLGVYANIYIYNLVIYICVYTYTIIYLYGMYDSLMTSCSAIAFLQGTGQIIPSAIWSWCYAKVRDTGAWSGGSQGLAVSWHALGGRTACIHRDNQTGSINRRLRRKFILRAWHWVPGTMARWSLAEEVRRVKPSSPPWSTRLFPGVGTTQ